MNFLLQHMRVDGTWREVFRGVKRQTQVVEALMLRSAMAFNGHENLGFFWVVGEPMLLTAGVMAMWSITEQTHGSGEVGVVPFALTGYTHITLWRRMVFGGLRGMTHHAALLYLSPVKFIDPMIANFFLHLFAILAAFLVVYIPLTLIGAAPFFHDPLLSLSGYFLGGWFGFAFGLNLLAISEVSEIAEKFVHPMMYITLPATGIFTMLDWLPTRAQKYLSWSPLVSAIEMLRGGIFTRDLPTHYDVWYLIGCCILLTATGLPACQYVQRRVQV